MKIAFVVSIFPSMSEKFIVSQIIGLLDRGHDVRIFPSLIVNEDQVHEEIEKYDLMQRICCNRQIPKSRLARIIRAIILICMNLPSHPILITRALVLFMKKYRKVSLLGFFNWVTPFITGNFDIVHSHFGPNGNRTNCLREIGISAKLITTFHGYDVTTYIKENGSGVYKELFELSDLFTYNSESTKQNVLALGCPVEKMVKLPMGIHLENIEFAERTIGEDKCVNVLSVGRLVEMKGREYAIKAMAKVIRNHRYVKYYIVGDGTLKQQLQSLIVQEQMTDSIFLEGWVSTEKLDQLYRNAHIFLHPSVVASNGNTEGQGVVLAEAQAYGLPVVATIHGAFPDSVDDGKSGYLVPERDVESLVEKIEYLVMNPQKWPEMGRNGRKFVDRFDNNMLTDRLLEIYNDLILPAGHAAKKVL